MSEHIPASSSTGRIQTAPRADTDSSNAVSMFWQRYVNALEKHKVNKKARRWYVARVEQYIKEAKGRRLAAHGPDDVRAYLEHMGRNARLEAWQVAQTAHALQILFCDVVGVSWGDQVDWLLWREGGESLGPTHPTVARVVSPVPVPSRPAGEDGAEKTSKGAATNEEVIGRVIRSIRARRYSIRTEQAYVGWIRRFVSFTRERPLLEMGAAEMAAFLEDLVLRGRVAAGTQNQALNALVFLYDKVLEQPVGDLGEYARSKRPRHLPVVLSRSEATRLLDSMDGLWQLMAGLLYGSGMRLMECVRLRVKDVDFDYGQLIVRNAKGLARCTSRTRWRASTPMARGNGDGNMRSPAPGCRWTPGRTRVGVTIFTKTHCRSK
jgi:hypothetical protein